MTTWEIERMTRSVEVLAEFTEKEGDGSTERPQLAKALELCRARKALLLIGTTDAIGGGREFEPDFVDVPYEVAYRKADEWPDLIPLGSCAFPVALQFGKQLVRGHIPLYLANGTGNDFLDVDVVSRGSSIAGGEFVETIPASRHLGPIPAGHARLIEGYDVYFDGDFVIEYQIKVRLSDGTNYSGQAIMKDVPPSRWLRIEQWNPMSSAPAK